VGKRSGKHKEEVSLTVKINVTPRAYNGIRHEAIPRESYDSYWVPNIDLTLHKITAERLIDRRTFMRSFFVREKHILLRKINPVYKYA